MSALDNILEYHSQSDNPEYKRAAAELAALHARVLELEKKEAPGTLPAADIRRAFVAGARWWEFEDSGGTMWPSDRNKADDEAEKRYSGGVAELEAPRTCATCKWISDDPDFQLFQLCGSPDAPVARIWEPEKFGCIYHAPRPTLEAK